MLLPDSKDQNLENLLHTEFTLPIDRNLSSPATSVIFSNKEPLGQLICLKMWVPCDNGLYDTRKLEICNQYTLEGLKFNRRFAPDVYYGLVPVYSKSDYEITCGPLIREPVSYELASDQSYALVMKRLDENLRLDFQLTPDKLGNKPGMEFLACQIAEMHKKLVLSPTQFGMPEDISRKLHLNIWQFSKALYQRNSNQQGLIDLAIRENGVSLIKSVPRLLKLMSKTHMHSFTNRHQEGKIKRCHGDLKATNLWFYPSKTGLRLYGRLMPLDCIDFNPDFYNIDTLSDVAMLAIDLETRLGMNAERDNTTIWPTNSLDIFFMCTLKTSEKVKWYGLCLSTI